MLTAKLALFVVPFVLLQGPADRPDLSRQLAQRTRSAFEGSDADRLSVVVLLRGETFASITLGAEQGASLGADKKAAFEASFDGGLHAMFATLAMQLHDRGELDLERGVGSLLPELGTTVGKVTAHELLTHTAALHDWEEFAAATPADRLKMLGTAGTLAEPGTCFQPSTGNTFVLGMLLQRAVRAPVMDRIATDLFERSGVSSVGACEKGAAAAGLASAMAEPELCGTGADLAALLHTMSRRALTSERSWNAMTSGDLLPDGSRTRYGHGLDLARLGEHERVAFGGVGGGARLQAAYYPAFDMTIAVLAAGRAAGKPFDAQLLERDLARAVFAVESPTIRDLPLEPEPSARFTGEYLIGCDRAQVLFLDRHLVLMLLRRDPIVLLRQSEDEFVAAQDHDLGVRFEPGAKRAGFFVLAEHGFESRAKRID